MPREKQNKKKKKKKTNTKARAVENRTLSKKKVTQGIISLDRTLKNSLCGTEFIKLHPSLMFLYVGS